MKLKPTLNPGLDASTYHSGPEVSSTLLKHMAVSPAHAYAYMTEKKDSTALMKFGTAWHAHYFEPEVFKRDYIIVPDGLDKRTKDGKAVWADIEASGKEQILAKDAALIERMSANASDLLRSKEIGYLDSEVLTECSIFSEIYGVEIRIRPDLLVMPCSKFPRGLIVDGKTCADASPEGFGRHAWNNLFHIQAALYSHTVARLFELDEPFAPFSWLAVERGSPNCALYHDAPEALLQYGWEEVLRLIDEFKACKRWDDWPGYKQESSELLLPSYAMRVINGDDGEISFEQEMSDE